MRHVPDLVSAALGFVERREPAADHDRLREQGAPPEAMKCLKIGE